MKDTKILEGLLEDCIEVLKVDVESMKCTFIKRGLSSYNESIWLDSYLNNLMCRVIDTNKELSKYLLCSERIISRYNERKKLSGFIRLAENNNNYRTLLFETVNLEGVIYIIWKEVDGELYTLTFKTIENLEHLSTHDVLTGLRNRLSYNKIIEKYDDWENVGVLYTDLNMLKSINDSKGHEYGDDYIIQYSNTLKKFFRIDDCYRLGGDEFVVIVRGIENNLFECKVREFLKIICNRTSKSIASVGYKWKESSKDILKVVRECEYLMYKDKEEYRKMTGRLR